MEYLMKVLTILASTIGTFSIIATQTPNRSANAILDLILRCINAIGMNFGNARNEN